ncbi:general substrate transporter [Talaromyces proteolyticus]|uniref:General substrate transporter n=1 Tax=Talaromyces proteolyticus TaxID=1131652 RepID=A0AAD4PZS8_9EURO|nr:general substrate transporter [Talaromyces proteolyticus]KAH8696291.1 general substrate transporter [Talaromyces proteolyticus]
MAKLSRYNIFISIVAAIGAYSYGFGSSVFATSIGQPGFFNYFKLEGINYSAPSIDSAILGALNALFYFGLATGSLIQAWAVDIIGRKLSFAISALVSLIGSALVTGSVAVPMIIVVRMLQGVGLGMLLFLVPLYITEIAPPQHRGLLTGLTTVFFSLGYSVCAFISVGTYFAQSPTVQWRLPLGLSCLGPLVLLLATPYLVESPRYLALVGRNNEALAVLKKIHHDPTDNDNTFAEAEYIQIVRQIEFDKGLDTGILSMVKKPSWRRRCLLAFFIQFSSQSTGVLLLVNYITIIFSNLGMTGVMPLLLYAIMTVTNQVALFIGMFTVDKIGRRTLFLIGFPLLAVCLLVEGILQWKYLDSTNKSGLYACVVFIYLFFFIFCLCIDVTSFIWVSEIFPTAIRSKGVSIGFFAYFTGALTYTTPGALIIKNLQYNMFYLYAGLCVVSTAVVYFFVPETKKIPVEEIGALFGDVVVVHLTADGQGIVEEEKGVVLTHAEFADKNES